MGWIKFIDEDGVIDFDDMNEDQLFQVGIDLMIEQEKMKGSN